MATAAAARSRRATARQHPLADPAD